MPNRKVAPPTFEELITKIWDQGDGEFRMKPRFCIDPDKGAVAYIKYVTHYDFVWRNHDLFHCKVPRLRARSIHC